MLQAVNHIVDVRTQVIKMRPPSPYLGDRPEGGGGGEYYRRPGKAHGVPVHALLGGAYRDEVPTYVSGLPKPTDAQRAALAAEWAARGVRGVKLHLGHGVDADLATYDAVAVGEALRNRYEFRAWLQARAVDLCQPDVARTGITEAMAIAEVDLSNLEDL